MNPFLTMMIPALLAGAVTAVVYVGDDVTDESAFRAVEPNGLGIRVGGDEPSSASCRVDSPAEVASVLSWFASTGAELLAESAPATGPRVQPKLPAGR